LVKHSHKIWISASIFAVISGLFYIFGMFFSDVHLKFTGFMLIASTFLPFPADAYILYASNFFSPLKLAIFGGLMNAIAVIYEKYFVRLVIRLKRFEDIVLFFNNLKFIQFSQKNLFGVLLFSAFSFFPFEPFRLVAITHNYNDVKYLFATFFGRGFRFFLLGLLGKELIKYDWLGIAIGISLGLFIYGSYVGYVREKKRRKRDSKIKLDK